MDPVCRRTAATVDQVEKSRGRFFLRTARLAACQNPASFALTCGRIVHRAAAAVISPVRLMPFQSQRPIWPLRKESPGREISPANARLSSNSHRPNAPTASGFSHSRQKHGEGRYCWSTASRVLSGAPMAQWCDAPLAAFSVRFPPTSGTQ